jgi:uncharacterized membrane protein YqjE
MIQQSLRLVDTVLCEVQQRFELLAIEFQEEKSRFIELMFWACLGLFAAVMGVIVLTLTIIFLFSAENRGYAAVAFGILYLLGTAWAFNEVRSRLKATTPPLLGTISELKKDREAIFKHKRIIQS